jgi:hypothetical protein
LKGERAKSFRAKKQCKKNLKVVGLEVGSCFGSIRLATDKTPQARFGLGKVIKQKGRAVAIHEQKYDPHL